MKHSKICVPLVVQRRKSLKHQAKFKAKKNRQITDKKFILGESHYFKGKRYLLNIIEQKALPKVIIRENNYLDIYIRKGTSKQQPEQIIKEWYKQELKNYIPAIIAKWQPIIRVIVADWRIKFMRTRWGTCNIEAQRIWLNLELAKKPIHCL